MTRASGRQSALAALARQLMDAVAETVHPDDECSLLVLRPVDVGRGSVRTMSGALPTLSVYLRPLIRRGDDIVLDDGAGLGLVLHAAGPEGARAVYHRLSEALQHMPEAPDTTAPVALTLGIGYATLASPHAASDAAVHAAAAAAWRPRTIITISVPLASATAHPSLAPRARKASGRGRRTADAATTSEAPEAPEAFPPTVAPNGDALASVRQPARPRLRLVEPPAGSGPEGEALRLRASALGVPFVHLPARIPPACRKAFAPELARELRAVAIGRTRGALTVAMGNPGDAAAIRRLRLATGMAIFPVLVAPDELDRALRQMGTTPPPPAP